MAQIKSLADLKALKNSIHEKMDTRVKGNKDGLVQVKVAMATCGIDAGAKTIFNYIMEQADKKGLEIVLSQTGCMGYCHAEPTIEVTLPGKEPIVFGHVDKAKADEIMDKYIKNGELVEGIIPVNYNTIDK